MKIFIKFLAVMMAVLMLGGCRKDVIDNTSEFDSSAISNSSGISGEEKENIPPEILEQMKKTAFIHENYCMGKTISEDENIYPLESSAFGLLYENDLLAPYADGEEYWQIPGDLIAKINDLIYANLEQPQFSDGETDEFGYGGVWEKEPYELVMTEAESIGGERISVTYNREMEGKVLCPVTYVFAAEKAEEIPSELAGIYQQGDTVYKIESVTQRNDLLPEKSMQTIEISTAEELLAAAKRINEGGYENSFDTYILTADIDLSGVEWVPMGLNNCVLQYWIFDERDPNLRGFNGTFDGNGHTISNFTLTPEQCDAVFDTAEQNFPERMVNGIGFFYYIGEKGTVRNLNFKNADVSLSLKYKNQGTTAGILAAHCVGYVENVSVEGSITGPGETGGMIGYLGESNGIVGTAKNCRTNTNVTGCSSIGGMIGLLHYGNLIGCTAEGIVTAVPSESSPEEMPGSIGGIIGHIIEGNAADCYASCYVLTNVPSRLVGGFCGIAEGGSITSCSVNGKKSGKWEAIDDIHRMEPEIEIKY